MQVTYGPEFGIAKPLISLDQATGEIVAPSCDPLQVRAWIMAVTNKLLALPQGDQIEMEVKHTIDNGMYMRELFIPKGSFLVGKIHKVPCLNIVSKGDISVITETGSARVQAGYTVASPAGIQKMGYAHEDTVFINVFRTDETDLEKIEQLIAFDSYEAASAECITNTKETLCL